jgi:hypothetical protein
MFWVLSRIDLDLPFDLLVLLAPLFGKRQRHWLCTYGVALSLSESDLH